MCMKSKILTSGIFILSLFAISGQIFAAKNPDDTSKYKSGGPIEITSNSLEVLQQEHKAIFTGHVIATQGDVKMKSEKMTVFYKSTEAKNEKAAKKEKPTITSAPEQNSIEKIVVEKDVFLSTPEETASGMSGLYDVANHKIYLNDNVVLTRDKNVLKGSKLVYNFETGKSELNSSNGAVQSDGKTKQRVKALFIPDSDKKNTLKK